MCVCVCVCRRVPKDIFTSCDAPMLESPPHDLQNTHFKVHSLTRTHTSTHTHTDARLFD